VASATRFDRLADQHKDAVYRQMIRVCGNHDDAEDVLVEALLRAYRNIDKLEDPALFRAWLATIGKRVCYRIKRQESLAPVLRLDDVAEPSSSPEHDVALLHDQVQELLDDMSPTLATVYRMRDLEGLSGEETAEKLGITLEAMKSRVHRARAVVRRRLDKCIAVPC